MQLRKADGSPFTRADELKYEIARDLGLLDKVIEGGWGALTTRESGRVGGILSRRMRQEQGGSEDAAGLSGGVCGGI